MQIEDFKDLTHAEREVDRKLPQWADTIINRGTARKGQPRQHHPRRADPGAVAGHGRTPPPGRDYETFRAWLYALDVFITLDALG